MLMFDFYVWVVGAAGWHNSAPNCGFLLCFFTSGQEEAFPGGHIELKQHYIV